MVCGLSVSEFIGHAFVFLWGWRFGAGGGVGKALLLVPSPPRVCVIVGRWTAGEGVTAARGCEYGWCARVIGLDVGHQFLRLCAPMAFTQSATERWQITARHRAPGKINHAWVRRIGFADAYATSTPAHCSLLADQWACPRRSSVV